MRAHTEYLLFGKSPDYAGTELLRDGSNPRRYLTLDRWTSATAFARFKAAHAAEYAALDARCEAWMEAEERVGEWTSLG